MSSIEAIIDRQIRRWELERALRAADLQEKKKRQIYQPVITISRQRGTGGSIIGEKLSERFGYTLLNRDIIDRICESTGHKRRIIESLDDHVRSQFAIWFESIIAGKYVDLTDYMKHLLETIYSVAQLGGVVVVGRGANFIVGRERGFHLRVVADKKDRIKNLVAFEGLSEKDAEREIEHSDHDRAEFVKKQFGKSIDDPLHYDLALNLSMVSLESATNLVGLATMEKFQRLRQTTT